MFPFMEIRDMPYGIYIVVSGLNVVIKIVDTIVIE